jgi:AraC-like DNA-binding protein
MDISLSGIQVIDLFFRFAAVGQLTLIIVYLVDKYDDLPLPQISLVLTIIAYILLTAPIEDQHYGGLRNVLLLFTDLTPFAALWFTLQQLNPKFSLALASKWITVPVMLWVLGLVYFFLVVGGKGLLHDVNHGLGIALLMTVIYMCLSEFLDDLDQKRRNTRLLLVAFCSSYMVFLVSFEFVYRSVRDTWQFSLINAFTMCFIILTIASKLLFKKEEKVDLKSKSENHLSGDEVQLKKLSQFMDEKVYLQQELTIGKLSELLDLPVHQLRLLINQHLGFSNFSHYLNSFRIPWVCAQLQQKERKQIPILTIALEAGYGSIAPFNRAFKKQMGLTPTQYRDQF